MSSTRVNGINGRFFLVGCERSRTTLLQVMLAQHSRVFSFPESHVFCRIVPRKRLYRRLGIANWRTAAPVIHELAERCLGMRDAGARLPRRSPLLRSYVGAFVRLTGRSALDSGKDIWLEKTPHHLFQVEAIEHMVPEARFIHILRDGRDVTASIRDASLSDGAYWGEWPVERLAQHWNESIRESRKYAGRPAHFFVSYESLIENPALALRDVCEFVGVEPEAAMSRHWEAAGRVTGWMGSRAWMDNTHKPVQDTRLKKYREVFSDAEREYLEARLLDSGRVSSSSSNSKAVLAPVEVS
jgi:hypothetical protein